MTTARRAQHAPAGAPMPPADAIDALCARVRPVGVERVVWREAPGRVLAQAIALDRDSPACDVSAMDGYAVRLVDCGAGSLPVRDEVRPGECARETPRGCAVRVFTGAMIPEGADAVIQREHVKECGDHVRLTPGMRVEPGQHIRRQGENARAGAVVLEPGCALTPPRLGAAASCGAADLLVHTRVRVGVLTTGDETLDPSAAPAPWELRDANGPALAALLAGAPWIDPIGPRRVSDDPDAIRAAAASLLEECDALLLTGGVSAGDYDFVPEALRALGFETVFHKTSMRPGKPALGAVDADGRPALGLPGNPVSVMVTARLFAAPALRARAGMRPNDDCAVFVDVESDATAPPTLRWFPPVRLIGDGRAALVRTKGSGDWVGAADTDGFIEILPGEPARGRRRFRSWRFNIDDRTGART